MTITLRKFNASDIPNKVRWINDPRNNAFLHYDLPLEIKKTTQWYESVKNRTDRYDAIVEADGVPVGLIGLLCIDDKHKKAEYYISMGEHEYKGKGIAYAASQKLLEYAFLQLNLHKVYLNVDSQNIAACALYEKLKFDCEGEFVEDLFIADNSSTENDMRCCDRNFQIIKERKDCRSMFQFNYIYHEKLAKLGWCMKIKKNDSIVDVHVGSYVETYPEWFVSGVWDDDFLTADFEGASFLCATAVKTFDNGLTVYSPTHERQRFCYIAYEDCLYFSNSIPLLLALTGESFDVNCCQYEKILCAILDGTKNYEREIPLAHGKTMYQVFCADITVDKTLAMTYQRKAKHRDFVDYNDYYNTLVEMCGRIRDNGNDVNRKHPYTLATTASSGYDSSTCAAIAKKVGCDTLLTFKGGHYDKDSAVDIGKKLSYTNIIERGYRDFYDKKNSIDAEFLVCGDHAAYLQFSAFEDDFADHIVFSGTSGSYIWDKDSDVNEDSVRNNYNFYTSNLSFSENALIKGYVFFPMALYGSSAAVSIQKITNSPEMEPWTLHTSYDRPICRRVLETSGVEREAFGHVKYGGGFSLARNFTKNQIRPKMSKDGFENFCSWLKTKGNNQWSFKRVCCMIRYHCAVIPDYVEFILRKMGFGIDFKHVVKQPNPGIPAKLIVWGMETVTEKYRSALSE